MTYETAIEVAASEYWTDANNDDFETGFNAGLIAMIKRITDTKKTRSEIRADIIAYCEFKGWK